VEEPDRREAEDPKRESNEPDGRERADEPPEVPTNGPTNASATEEDRTREVVLGEVAEGPSTVNSPEDVEGDGDGAERVEERSVEVAEHDDFRRRLEAKDRHVLELYDKLAAARIAADEARARLEAGEVRVRDLEGERERLREMLRDFEDEERVRRRRREGQDRRAAKLEREIERREDDIRRLEDLLARREGEMTAHGREAQSAASRKEVALEDALRRIEGLERDLEVREDEVVGLRATIDQMRAELDLEYELRRRMAEPANRLRAGIDLFNDSEHLQEIGSISKSLGRPEVHVGLGSDGDEPPVVLTFTWGAITWRTYVSNPGLAVREPRVYLEDTGEDLSGVDHEPSNAHVGAGGRVILGL
jgi:hypothetical protein